jgi:hypothetical protein
MTPPVQVEFGGKLGVSVQLPYIPLQYAQRVVEFR